MQRFSPLPLALLAGALLAAACGGGSSNASATSAQDSGSTGADGGERPPDSGTQAPDSGTQAPDSGTQGDAGTHGADGGTHGADGGTQGSDAGTQGSDAGTQGSDAGPPPGASTTMHLDSASAQVIGRRGLDVRIALSGRDTARSIAGVMVRLLDADGNAVAGFDSHQSGVLDSELGPATLAASVLGQSSISTFATVEGLAGRTSGVASVAVSLRDVHGLFSNEVVAPVVAQPVRQSGEACDPSALQDRCASPLGCRGTPTTCQEGLAPEITQLAFQRSDAGPTILMAGTSPEDDLSNIHVDFEDSAGNSITVALDGENAPPVPGFDLRASGDSSNGTFLISLQQAPGFDSACPQIAVTATDAANHTGATRNAVPVTPPLRAAGGACDPQGFDACAPGYVCAPGVPPAGSTCQALSSLQTSRCINAVHLAPTAGKPAQTYGHTALPSLWDAPRGCSGFNPTGRPEGVAQLYLAQPASTLTLSLDNPGTDFDTTMYLLQGCPGSSAAALACDDDNGTIGVSSVLVLQNVPAGTYTVVVDSFKPHGGNYQLTASVQ